VRQLTPRDLADACVTIQERIISSMVAQNSAELSGIAFRI
jgi:hypothetical protein